MKRKDSDGEIEERLAEILSIRDKPTNAYSRRPKTDEYADQPNAHLEFFVHWDQFNKRLDEWISGARVVLSRDLEWPRPKLAVPKKSAPTNKALPGKNPKKSVQSRISRLMQMILWCRVHCLKRSHLHYLPALSNGRLPMTKKAMEKRLSKTTRTTLMRKGRWT